jgi:uncharacterized protein YfaT (DUF1175 family)
VAFGDVPKAKYARGMRQNSQGSSNRRGSQNTEAQKQQQQQQRSKLLRSWFVSVALAQLEQDVRALNVCLGFCLWFARYCARLFQQYMLFETSQHLVQYICQQYD